MLNSSIDYMFKDPTVTKSESDMEIDKFNVHCYRKSGVPLVYLATYKCASTFYKTLLLDNGWDQIPFSEIDWQKDQVFGFLTDPRTRFIKGIVQDLCNATDTEPELHDKIFDLLKNHKSFVLPLTDHSMPIALILKEYMNKVDWIPIYEGFPTFQLFTKLLEKYSLKVEPGPNVDPNVSNEYKRNLYKKFAEAFGSGNQLYHLTVAGNVDLFNKVKTNINHRGRTWEEISWLSASQ